MSTTQARPNFWHNLALKTRFAHARLKKGTVRFKTSNLASVYAAYEERGIAYVVLRWAAEVPMEQSEEAGYTKDVDHLIAAKDVIGRAGCFFGLSGEDQVRLLLSRRALRDIL